MINIALLDLEKKSLTMKEMILALFQGIQKLL
jgi:hypothetical protein